MKYMIPVMVLFWTASGIVPVWAAQQAANEPSAAKSIEAVLVTGGHDFDENAVLPFFKGLEGVHVTHAPQRDDSELFEDVADWRYDVIVFYNMGTRISPEREKNLLGLLDKGTGVVVLHHAMADYPDWAEFETIAGVRYLLKPREQDGTAIPGSTYQHDRDFKVHVADPEHPVTKGVADFEVHDETYKGCVFAPDNKPLLTTEDETSDLTIGWARKYKNSKVCVIQVGHGPQVFGQEPYRRLLTQAIRFCSPGATAGK